MEEKLRKYAELILKKGVSLQKGQWFTISAPVEAADFVRIVVIEAYRLGAYDVEVTYSDGINGRTRIECASEEALSCQPKWKADRDMYYAEKGCCRLSIVSPDPYLMKCVDSKRIAINLKANMENSKKINELMRSNKIRWNAAAVPNPVWAKKIFPELNEEAAVAALWDDILKTAHADCENPVQEWESHITKLCVNRSKLNLMGLISLNFKSKNGTDVEIGLCEDVKFQGGRCMSPDGICFSPNIPTEEVFAAPHKYNVNGIVKNSIPLFYSGNKIDGFALKFEEGKVVDFEAELGAQYLENILNVDEGARHLGECALVPYTSPIRQTGHIFYNTLFDENAACHLALGMGFPDSVSGEDRSMETLQKKGLNTSLIHVDFMFGTEDMECIGTTKSGKKIQILKEGIFAI